MVPYGVNEKGFLDYDQIRDLARQCRPRMIVAGASAYPRIIDYKAFADIAHEVGALSVRGHGPRGRPGGRRVPPLPRPLRRRGVHHHPQDPSGVPRGGLLLCNDGDIAKKLDLAIFPGSQGGPLEHIIAAKAVALGEALKPEFKTYQEQVVKNAQALAPGRAGRGAGPGVRGHRQPPDCWWTCAPPASPARRWSGGWTRRSSPPTRTPSPTTRRSPSITSGIRLGTPAVTSRGFREKEMALVGQLVCAAAGDDFDSRVDDLRAQVTALTSRFPLYEG